MRFRIEGYGKAARYGEGVYKFGSAAQWLLQDNGWTLVKRTRHYCYLCAPDGAGKKNPEVVAEPLTEAAVRELGAKLNGDGVPAVGAEKGWPFVYLPSRRAFVTQEAHVAKGIADFSRRELAPVRCPASLEVGLRGAWCARLEWGPDPGAEPLLRIDGPHPLSTQGRLGLPDASQMR